MQLLTPYVCIEIIVKPIKNNIMKLSKESWGVVLFSTVFAAVAVGGLLVWRDNMANGFKFKA